MRFPRLISFTNSKTRTAVAPDFLFSDRLLFHTLLSVFHNPCATKTSCGYVILLAHHLKHLIALIPATSILDF